LPDLASHCQHIYRFFFWQLQNTKLTPTSTHHHATMESGIQDTIENIESLDSCETFSYREMAAKHNADRTTLSQSRHANEQAE
jgi:hypothetical protein